LGRKSTTYSAPRYSSVWPFLAAEALDFGHGDALHANTGQRFAHFVQLERFDDGRYEFHFQVSSKDE
jgi:hypothetical protein